MAGFYFAYVSITVSLEERNTAIQLSSISSKTLKANKKEKEKPSCILNNAR